MILIMKEAGGSFKIRARIMGNLSAEINPGKSKSLNIFQSSNVCISQLVVSCQFVLLRKGLYLELRKPRKMADEVTSPSASPSKPLSETDRLRVEEKRKAALKRLEESAKRRAAAAALDEPTTTNQHHENGVAVPVQKRAKTEAEVRLEEELKDVVKHGQIVRIQGTKVIDTGGGFLLEDEDLVAEEQAEKVIIVEPAAIVPTDTPTCEECKRNFSSSYLLHNYDLSVCDSCRDSEGVHSYITRTDAKNEFLLKDEDFDKREPPLRFLSRPNPHNSRWGDMKLYLRLQVERRAIEVHGDLEKIEQQREAREENRVKGKIKKYNKKMVSLRMAARSSLYTRDLSAHTHTWGPESYNEEEDTYSHTCTQCDKSETYEKM